MGENELLKSKISQSLSCLLRQNSRFCSKLKILQFISLFCSVFPLPKKFALQYFSGTLNSYIFHSFFLKLRLNSKFCIKSISDIFFIIVKILWWVVVEPSIVKLFINTSILSNVKHSIVKSAK